MLNSLYISPISYIIIIKEIYMSRQEQAIFINMCMIYDNDKILIQKRTDPNWSGISFPGGHVEHGESFVESVIREVYEETGLTIYKPMLCGVKQFQNKDDTRYVVMCIKQIDIQEIFILH